MVDNEQQFSLDTYLQDVHRSYLRYMRRELENGREIVGSHVFNQAMNAFDDLIKKLESLFTEQASRFKKILSQLRDKIKEACEKISTTLFDEALESIALGGM